MNFAQGCAHRDIRELGNAINRPKMPSHFVDAPAGPNGFRHYHIEAWRGRERREVQCAMCVAAMRVLRIRQKQTLTE